MPSLTSAALDVARAAADLEAERDLYREHSATLNRVLWQLASAVGRTADPDAPGLEVDVDELVAEVVARLEAGTLTP